MLFLIEIEGIPEVFPGNIEGDVEIMQLFQRLDERRYLLPADLAIGLRNQIRRAQRRHEVFCHCIFVHARSPLARHCGQKKSLLPLPYRFRAFRE